MLQGSHTQPGVDSHHHAAQGDIAIHVNGLHALYLFRVDNHQNCGGHNFAPTH
jgi:hypothetical protein